MADGNGPVCRFGTPELESMRETPLRRPAVLLVLMDSQGRLLAGERRDVPDCWQFPQGGRKAHESALEALLRETREETGIEPADYSVGEPLGTWAYDFPPDFRKRKFTGQELVVYAARWTGEGDPVQDFAGSKEFRRLAWFSATDFPRSGLPDFKQSLYAAIFKEIRARLDVA